ncbi:Hypothetical Protein FCC1311_025511 [Hondaea fermentalgiana]|uniref:Fatty acid desaturase domain-containing protein n=1 Tax=Hondaea fermentalgiana TaxID=2315210 RepID=A0A2R5GG47_9STRA|nr:Hypothetical Protein FCC1311_025511 [Hondaea fermentalgiana]|eukprot:GBG29309.1 Hypothetical Protein FCC1311_025511 [Hondaea fermentalgiana]
MAPHVQSATAVTRVVATPKQPQQQQQQQQQQPLESGKHECARRKRYEAQGRRPPTAAEEALANLLGLRYYEDLRTLMFCCVYFTLVGLQLKYEVPFRSARFLVFWLTAFVSFQGAVTVHNAVHCPIFKQTWKNQIFQTVLSVWFGHCASSYVPGHNLSHHRNLQTNKDVMRTTKMKFRWNFLNGLLFMPTILISTSANDAAYFNAQATLKRPIYYQLRFEALVYVSFQLLVASVSPEKWLFVCWLPCLIGKYGIISLNMLQHDGVDTESKYNHSRNFVGPILNYFCFNNGYHGIHHMFPGKHWCLLKHEHETRVKPHIHPNLDQDNIFAFMFEQFIYPGKRIDYLGNPVPIIDDGPDEPWFYSTTETWSDRDVDPRVWSKKINQYGPDGKPAGPVGGMAPRAAKSYTTM